MEMAFAREGEGEGEGEASASYHPTAPPEIPRGECKAVVLGALAEVVREVLESRDKNGGGTTRRGKESVLRQAALAWLESVESGE
jgi:hypothetical protein